MIRYLLGRSGTGKSKRIREEIARAYDKDRTDNVILLVPEQFSLEASDALIEEAEIQGHIHMDVLSFKRLAHRVLSETGMNHLVEITDLGKTMLLRKAFEEHAASLQVFGRMAGRDGFMESFIRLLSEFKRAEVTPEALEQRIEPLEDGLLRRKLEDITLLYTAFQQKLTDAYVDEEGLYSLLLEKIDQVAFLKDAKIWIDGFNGFTGQEYSILEKLMTRCAYVTVALTVNSDPNASDRETFDATWKTLRRLHQIAKDHDIEEKKTSFPLQGESPAGEHQPREATMVRHLEKALYAYPTETFQGLDNSLMVMKATSKHIEVEMVADQILHKVREHGWMWRDVAVVAADLDTYGLAIKRSFQEHDIPFFMDEKRPVTGNPIIQYVLSLLNTLQGGFLYEDVFRMVKTGLSNLSRAEGEMLENYCLAYGIKGKQWQEAFHKGSEAELEVAEPLRQRLMASLEGANKSLKGRLNVRQRAEALVQHFADRNLYEALDQWTEELRAAQLLDEANEAAQIWNILMEVLDQLVELMGEEAINLKTFIQLLETGFSTYQIGVIPPARDRVLVGSLERSRTHEIKALFILGINDGVLPSAGTPGGVLQDEEKEYLQAEGLELKSDFTTLAMEEQLSIYQTIARPTDFLAFSCALGDDDGKAKRPSILLERVLTLFPDLRAVTDVIPDESLEWSKVTRPAATFKHVVKNMRDQVDGNPTASIWWDVQTWYAQSPQWTEALNRCQAGLFHKNQVSTIGQSHAHALYNTPLHSSVSRMERYVQCPFSHFVQYGLRPSERKEYAVALPDIGTIYHYSLEAFSKVMHKEKLDWFSLERQDCERMIDQVVDEVTGKYGNVVFESNHRYQYLVERIKRVGRRAAWTLAEQVRAGKFIPAAFELAFEDSLDPYTVPPIVIELPSGERIYLEGRIDRVDILKDGDQQFVKIVDYKSGSRRFSLSDAFHGLQIQLIVYLDAILTNKHYLRADELYPSGVFYFKIDDPMIESAGGDREAIEAEIKRTLKMDGLAVEEFHILQSMDESLDAGTKSDVIPVEIKKDGTVSSRSSTIETEAFTALISHVRHLVGQIGQEIVDGKIRIEPCKHSGITSCDWCPYRGICQFDQQFEDNSFRYIRKLSDEEVMDHLVKEEDDLA